MRAASCSASAPVGLAVERGGQRLGIEGLAAGGIGEPEEQCSAEQRISRQSSCARDRKHTRLTAPEVSVMMAKQKRKSHEASACHAAALRSRPVRPTTRTIALQVREHGAGSLDQAQRRADEARYQEITCRSALNPVKGMPFNWTLNPYRGCTHALPLLLRAPLPDAVRARARRRVLVADLREGELRRGAAARARQAVVDARAGGARHRDRSVSADRRALQADAAHARGARSPARTPVGHRHQGPDDRARRGPARRARRASRAARSASACRPWTRTRGARSSPAPPTRCSGCARCARCATPASTPAC